MHYSSELPFELGETLKGKDDDGNLINNHVLGKVFIAPVNNNASTTMQSRLTGRQLKVVAVRNTLGQAALPKLLVQFPTAGYDAVEVVDGYAALSAQYRCGAVDPYLPSSGCADDDIMWVIVEGVTTCKTPFAGASFGGDIAAGAPLVAATGSTTGSSSMGRVGPEAIANATDAAGAFNNAVGVIGTALSARTTGETDSDILVHMKVLMY